MLHRTTILPKFQRTLSKYWTSVELQKVIYCQNKPKLSIKKIQIKTNCELCVSLMILKTMEFKRPLRITTFNYIQQNDTIAKLYLKTTSLLVSTGN